jgi:hypothetical protein
VKERDVRDLVYLSRSKLDQITVDRPRQWPASILSGEVEVAMAGIFKALLKSQKVPVSDVQRLAHALGELARAGRSDKWFFEDPHPGGWVYFEAPLNFAKLPVPDLADMTLFRDTVMPPDYPISDRHRLLLHGSTQNMLVGSTGDPRGQTTDASSPASFYRVAGTFSARRPRMTLAQLARLLRRRDELVYQNFDELGQRGPHDGDGDLEEVFRVLVDRLDAMFSVSTAAWMSGVARVTATCRGRSPSSGRSHLLVVASPLYVEYCSRDLPA